MTDFIKTPFDDFILLCTQSQLSNPAYPAFTDLRAFLMTQAKTFRVCYINMKKCAETFEKTLEDMRKGPGGHRSCTTEEMISMSDNTIMTALAFFQFLAAVNQFGRRLDRLDSKLLKPPLDKEVYFFRNKVIEHWDEYLGYGPVSHGMRGQKDKLNLPYHSGRKVGFLENQEAKQLLEVEFKRYIPSFSLPSTADPETYMKLVYDGLKLIDPELKSKPRYPKKGSKHIPEDLVELLYDSGFPAPFLDIEKYIDELLVYLQRIYDA